MEIDYNGYRYALLLERLGRKEEAIEILRALLASDEDIDEETHEAIEDAIADMETE